jgi:hypothetical protein
MGKDEHPELFGPAADSSAQFLVIGGDQEFVSGCVFRNISRGFYYCAPRVTCIVEPDGQNVG